MNPLDTMNVATNGFNDQNQLQIALMCQQQQQQEKQQQHQTAQQLLHMNALTASPEILASLLQNQQRKQQQQQQLNSAMSSLHGNGVDLKQLASFPPDVLHKLLDLQYANANNYYADANSSNNASSSSGLGLQQHLSSDQLKMLISAAGAALPTFKNANRSVAPLASSVESTLKLQELALEEAMIQGQARLIAGSRKRCFAPANNKSPEHSKKPRQSLVLIKTDATSTTTAASFPLPIRHQRRVSSRGSIPLTLYTSTWKRLSRGHAKTREEGFLRLLNRRGEMLVGDAASANSSRSVIGEYLREQRNKKMTD